MSFICCFFCPNQCFAQLPKRYLCQAKFVSDRTDNPVIKVTAVSYKTIYEC